MWIGWLVMEKWLVNYFQNSLISRKNQVELQNFIQAEYVSQDGPTKSVAQNGPASSKAMPSQVMAWRLGHWKPEYFSPFNCFTLLNATTLETSGAKSLFLSVDSHQYQCLDVHFLFLFFSSEFLLSTTMLAHILGIFHIY